MSLVENVSCVILNFTYEPLSIVPSSRALVLVFQGKASAVENHPELFFRTVSTQYPAPSSIVLKEYIKSRPAFREPAKLTARNLFIRDNYTCGYCGRKRAALGKREILTRDHIHPISKGGRDIWTNVIASCSRCNNKKADMTLREADMVLLKQPNIPSLFEIWSRNSKNVRRMQHIPHELNN